MAAGKTPDAEGFLGFVNHWVPQPEVAVGLADVLAGHSPEALRVSEAERAGPAAFAERRRVAW